MLICKNLLPKFRDSNSISINEIPDRRIQFRFGPSGDIYKIPCKSNKKLPDHHDDITRAVVVIHGNTRNAITYYTHTKEAAVLAGNAQDSTIIPAPQFLVQEDDSTHAIITDDILIWSYGRWKRGAVSDIMNLEILPGDFDLDIKVWLEGAYNGTNMNANLNGILPTNHPYGVPQWNYAGTESVGSIPNTNIVDWVLIELRDTTDASLATGETMIAWQAAFLLNDGSVVGLDGDTCRDTRPCVSTCITNNLFVVS